MGMSPWYTGDQVWDFMMERLFGAHTRLSCSGKISQGELANVMKALGEKVNDKASVMLYHVV